MGEMKKIKIPHDPDEIIAVVNEDDEVVGKSTRKEVHEKGLLHREASVFIVNSKGEVLLQQRADNEKWDASASGHFPYDMSYEEGALKELGEELGIIATNEDIEFLGERRHKRSKKEKKNNKIEKAFLLKKDIKIEEMKIEEGEIKCVKFFNKEELRKLIDSKEEGKDILTYTLDIFLEENIIPKLNS